MLRAVADSFFLRFHEHAPGKPFDERAEVLVLPHGRPNLNALGTFRGSHMIRDPRDVAVSGYFYHVWTDERWVHIPQEELAGKTYQEHLRSLGQEEGIAVEIRRIVDRAVSDMLAWDYGRPEFIELRYEDVIADQAGWFAKMFRHYGFHDRAVERAVAIAMTFSFERISKRRVGEVQEGSHLRSGQPGQWRTVFTPRHVALFKELAGPALVKLGYESDDTW